MLPQGVLGFQYEAERSSTGVTSLAGLPLYLDLVHSSGLAAAVRRHVQVAGHQGWLDIQLVLAVVFLNLAGGDCVDDLERLEADGGFAAVLAAIGRDLLSRPELFAAARGDCDSAWKKDPLGGVIGIGPKATPKVYRVRCPVWVRSYSSILDGKHRP